MHASWHFARSGVTSQSFLRIPCLVTTIIHNHTDTNMAQQEEHPINKSDWSKVYGEPITKPGSISVDELTAWYADKTPGKDFVVVDVRRSDCDVSDMLRRD